ncbi:MAG: glycosyltransferase family 4 protein [Candidatus Nealsonbacteria bacterium]
MKICYLTYSLDLDRGAGKFSKTLIDTFRDMNPEWDIVVLTTRPTGDPNEKPIIYADKYKLLINFIKIRSIIRECDVVHALDGFPFGVIAALATMGSKKKLIITGLGTGAIRTLYRPIYSKLLKWAYQRADTVTAISRYTAREINKKIPRLKIKVITPGVNFDEFKKESSLVPKEISEKKPYLLTVGTIKKRKGHHIALPAFAEVLKKIPELNYVIVGNPAIGSEYYLKLKETMQRLKIEDRVFIFSNIDQGFLRQLYNNAELFFLMSQNIGQDVEGFGLVFLEAAASALPVIGSKNCGAEDAILDKENGFLVEPDDIGAVSEAIIKILSDQDLKAGFSERSVAFAKTMDWRKQAGTYSEIYNINR